MSYNAFNWQANCYYIGLNKIQFQFSLLNFLWHVLLWFFSIYFHYLFHIEAFFQFYDIPFEIKCKFFHVETLQVGKLWSFNGRILAFSKPRLYSGVFCFIPIHYLMNLLTIFSKTCALKVVSMNLNSGIELHYQIIIMSCVYIIIISSKSIMVSEAETS